MPANKKPSNLLFNKMDVMSLRFRFHSDPEFSAQVEKRAVKILKELEKRKGEIALELALQDAVVLDTGLKEMVLIHDPLLVEVKFSDAAAKPAKAVRRRSV